MNRTVDHAYRCPECAAAMEVTDAVKEALLERGCAVCGAAVTPGAFTRVSSPGT